MRALVTGAAGFIGSHVCDLLRRSDYEVFGVDSRAGDSLKVVDITEPLPVLVNNLDVVIHLAALSHPRDCDTNPAKAFVVNNYGTLNVLKMALEGGARKVVFASSAHVYDIPPRYLPTDEVHPLRLNNTYTTTKLLGEQLCELYWQNHGLPYTILRLFNAYGPGQGAGYFVPDMIQKARTGRIDLRGGNNTKDWVYIDDVARAFLLALQSDFVGPINVGSGVETDLHTIAAQIALAMGAEFTASLTDGTRMWGDISRAKRILGWEPQVNVKEGLDACLDAAKAPRPVLS